MNKQKQTFTDPQTGEEIESTALARWGAGLAFGVVFGLFFGLLFGLFTRGIGIWLGLPFGLLGALVYGLIRRWRRPLRFGIVFGAAWGVFAGLLAWGLFALHGGITAETNNPLDRLIGGLVVGLISGLFTAFSMGCWGGLGARLAYPITQRVHHGIARQQHLRRQRLLRRQEFPHVPDGALSRALPPGKPEPTAASLSLAEPPEEAVPRLAAGVEEATTTADSLTDGLQGGIMKPVKEVGVGEVTGKMG
jgi:hypothetical protein